MKITFYILHVLHVQFVEKIFAQKNKCKTSIAVVASDWRKQRCASLTDCRFTNVGIGCNMSLLKLRMLYITLCLPFYNYPRCSYMTILWSQLGQGNSIYLLLTDIGVGCWFKILFLLSSIGVRSVMYPLSSGGPLCLMSIFKLTMVYITICLLFYYFPRCS